MIAFLDFDGVLHPVRSTVDQLFCRLHLFQDWLRNRPGVDVVISSSWRECHPLDELRSFFDGDLQSRVLGATPQIKRDEWAQWDGEPMPTRFERQREILQWLNRNEGPCSSWVALDDQAWLFPPHEPRLVRCDGSIGLTSSNLDDADRILGWSATDPVAYELEAAAKDIFESADEARAWLQRTHPMLGSRTPIQAAASPGGLKRVQSILQAIKHGGSL